MSRSVHHEALVIHRDSDSSCDSSCGSSEEQDEENGDAQNQARTTKSWTAHAQNQE